MLLRVLERLLALLIWAAVAAVAFLIATQRALDALGRDEQVVDTDAVSQAVAGFDPTAALSVVVAIGLVLLGLAVLLMELTPRRPRALPHYADDRLTLVLDRGGLERRLARTAETDAEVSGAKVRIRRRAKVTVHPVASSDDRSLRARVRDRLRGELQQLVERRTPKVKVDVTSSGGRVR